MLNYKQNIGIYIEIQIYIAIERLFEKLLNDIMAIGFLS